jgi:hypothetical protein
MSRKTPRPLAIPTAKTFGDLFSTFTTTKDGAAAPFMFHELDYLDFARAGKTPRQATMQIDPYCSVDTRTARGSLYVGAREAVCKDVRANTIFVADDRMSWAIIVWNEREALVLCKHGKILGDVWVAIIDPKTIPALES